MKEHAERAILEAVLYAVRCGCFFPVPEPKGRARPTKRIDSVGRDATSAQTRFAEHSVSAQDRTIPHG